MKTVHFASILALVAMTAFACSGDDDPAPGGNTSGDAGAAGESSGSSGTAGKGGGGTGNPDTETDGGVGGMLDAFAGSGGSAGAEAGAGNGGAELGGAAGAGGEMSAPAPLEIIGEWVDNYGGDQIIDETSWNAATIVEYDNATNTVYAQNSPDDQYNPSKFTKTVYTEPVNDSFYFCLIVYSAETLAAARADTTEADASDPETGGCSTFPWSKATKP